MKEVVSGNGGGILSQFVIGIYGNTITIKDWLIIRAIVKFIIVILTTMTAIVTSKTIGRKNSRVVMLGVLAIILFAIMLLRSSCGVL